jgi:trans-aconitate methyltransferase
MNHDQAIDWEGRYRDGATGWERPGLNPAFTAWLEARVLAPCRILVPGGGRSAEPLALAEAGFAVTVVDLAETAVATQRARLERLNVTARVEQANLLAWEPDAPFDAVYDQACLCALPPAAWPDYVDRLHRWLGGSGLLFILFMQTNTKGGPPFHCDMTAMRRLFAEPRWHWPDRLPDPVLQTAGRSEQPAVLQAV